MQQPNENPFQAPISYDVAQEATLVEQPVKPINVPWILGKWAIVCGVSAAPSFVFGLMVANSRSMEVIGMICGVITFIVGYTIVECTPQFQSLIRKRLVRTSARIGYGMRMLISVVFPLGAYIDIPTGILSITIANFVFGGGGEGRGEFGAQFESQLMSFVWFYSTTLLQGFFLNIILLVFVAVVYGIALLFSRPE